MRHLSSREDAVKGFLNLFDEVNVHSSVSEQIESTHFKLTHVSALTVIMLANSANIREVLLIVIL